MATQKLLEGPGAPATSAGTGKETGQGALKQARPGGSRAHRRIAARGAAGILAGVFAMAATGASAVADPVVQERQGTVVIRTNSCTGDELTFVGSWLYVIRQNRDGTYTYINKIHATADNQYTLNEGRKSLVDSSGGFELKGDHHAVIVSKGDAANLIAWFHFDFTVWPPVFTLSEACRG